MRPRCGKDSATVWPRCIAAYRNVRAHDHADLMYFRIPKVGWSEQEAALDGGLKLQIVNLLKAFRVLRRTYKGLFFLCLRNMESGDFQSRLLKL